MKKLIHRIFKEIKGIEIELPIRRMTYKEAMERYGVDKPDLRFGFELVNISDIVENSGFRVFSQTIENNGSGKGYKC